jgi:hypothetical protein
VEKITMQSFMDINDAFTIIEMESSLQNKGKIHPKIAYAINRNKYMFFQVAKQNKPFLNNMPKFLEFVSKSDNLKVNLKKAKEILENEEKSKKKNKKLIDNTQKSITEYNEGLKKLEEEYKTVIENHTKWIQEEVVLEKPLYKFSLEILPPMKQKVMDFLIESKLIIE